MGPLVFLDCVDGPEGSKLYSIRRDLHAPTGVYGEDEFWQLMETCLGAVTNARENVLKMLAEKRSLSQPYKLTPEGAARLGWV